MERLVTIDGKEYKLVANGATPRIYRGLFHKEVFSAMTKSAQYRENEVEILDTEVFENLAYCMAVQGGSIPTALSIDDWLASMSSPMAIIEATQEIMDMWFSEIETTSVGKKE